MTFTSQSALTATHEFRSQKNIESKITVWSIAIHQTLWCANIRGSTLFDHGCCYDVGISPGAAQSD